jgi:hypothetical protein
MRVVLKMHLLPPLCIYKRVKEMIRSKICRGNALSIAFGITTAFLMLVGGAGAVTTSQDFNYSANPLRARVSPDGAKLLSALSGK